jgi:hypothetical protein
VTKVGNPAFQSKSFFTSSTLLPLQTSCLHPPCYCPHLNQSAECPWYSFPHPPELFNWLLQLWEVWTFYQRLPISEAEQVQQSVEPREFKPRQGKHGKQCSGQEYKEDWANILYTSGHYTGERAGHDGYVSCGQSPCSHSL